MNKEPILNSMLNKYASTASSTASQTSQALIIATWIWGLLLLPALPISFLSMFLFDDPAANFFTLILFWSLFTFPVIIAISLIFSWFAYRNKAHKLAIWLSFLPLLNIVVATVSIWLTPLSIFLPRLKI